MIIVIVEDNKPLNFAIKLLLEKNGHCVFAFDNADDLIKNIDTIGKVDLFILDINLPGMDGLELMDVIKCYENSSFIIISAYNDISHITQAFKLGCDDYLKKPFEIEELLLRINRIQTTKYPRHSVEFGNCYKYDFDAKILEKDIIQKIMLRKKEIGILELLLLNRGKIISLDMIRENVWDSEYVTSNIISATIYRLRNKLAKDVIQTYRDVGYMIN